jgi:arylmalonate decarboxylase
VSTPKRRIGCIVPGSNVVVEEDFIRLCPPDASVHFARARIDTATPEQFRRMIDQAPDLAQLLTLAGVGVVGFACTGASFFLGPGSDDALARGMEASAKVPAVPTSSAVVRALRAVGARRISVATPYEKWLNDAEREFLAAAGFEVLVIEGLGLCRGVDIHALEPGEAYRLAREVDRPDADAVFISCTDFQALGVVERLERELGKPVVTSNQATFWACAAAVGTRGVSGYGRLVTAC